MPAAAGTLLAVDADLDPVGIGPAAGGAGGVDDVYVDPRGLVDFAGDADAEEVEDGVALVVDQEGERDD